MSFISFLRKEEVRGYISHSWELSWPMILIMSFEFLIGLTDVFVAGRVNKEIQAAYGFVIQSYFIFIVVANALTVGAVSVVSRMFSAHDREALGSAVSSSVAASAAAGFVIGLSGLLCAPAIIRLVNIPPQLTGYVIPMVQIYAGGVVFHYMLINSNGIMRSCNMILRSLKTMALVCAVNIGLNFILVFKTPLGFRGIALSTAISVTVGGLINLHYLRPLMGSGWRFAAPTVLKMAAIGWPMGILQILWQLGSIALFLILSAIPQHNVEILAALTAGLRIESAIYLPAFAFNMANAVIVGNLIGERKHDEAYRSGLVTASIGVAIVSFLVLIVVSNAWWIVSFLSTNEIVMRESVRYIYISMISEPFMAWGIILGGGMSGAGATRSVMIRVALSIWLIRIPLCYLFVIVLGFGPASVWWSMNASQFVQCFLLYRKYARRDWLGGT